MMNNEIKLLNIINQSTLLQEALNFNMENNNSLFRPYHNIIHIFNVMHSVVDILNNYDVPVEKQKLLLLTAMFHDFNHSGGELNDSENIKMAKDGIIYFASSIYMKTEDLSFVLDLLDVTEYPYKKSNDELTLIEKILRDADLSQVMKLDTYFAHNLIGLKYELKTDNCIGNQRNFIENLEYATTYMQDKWKIKKEEILEYQKIIENIC